MAPFYGITLSLKAFENVRFEKNKASYFHTQKVVGSNPRVVGSNPAIADANFIFILPQSAITYLVNIKILSKEASPVKIQFVDPFIWGRVKINIEIKLPTSPKIPTQLSNTPWTMNSTYPYTSSDIIILFSSNVEFHEKEMIIQKYHLKSR